MTGSSLSRRPPQPCPVTHASMSDTTLTRPPLPPPAPPAQCLPGLLPTLGVYFA